MYSGEGFEGKIWKNKTTAEYVRLEPVEEKPKLGNTKGGHIQGSVPEDCSGD